MVLMASSIIELKELEKYVDNIYEAVVIIAKRAKQINDEQKQFLETELALDEEIDELEDDSENESADVEEQKYIKLPKPTKIAIEEFLSGKIKYEYLDRQEES